MSAVVGERKSASVEKGGEHAEDRPGAKGDLPKVAPATSRMLSLDVFRGITVAGMILVNNPGTWGAIYSPLEHAAWHGWTPTDLIFPFFLFIVGISITLALSQRVEAGGGKRDLYIKITRRTSLIILLGLFLAGFPYFNLSTIRFTGVLNRIALCYFFSALIFLKTNWRQQTAIVAGILLAYWAVLTLVAAPGFAAGDLSKEGSIASYIDRLVLGNHIWKGGDKVYDPEGILSTFPAIATTLCGVLTGHLLRSRRTPPEKVAAMFVAGVAGVITGWAWNYWLPVNKPLWTSSYVLFTAGMALQLLALCYWLVDIQGYKRWSLPFIIFGMNALAVFFLTGLAARLLTIIKLTGEGGNSSRFRPSSTKTSLLVGLLRSMPRSPSRSASCLYGSA